MHTHNSKATRIQGASLHAANLLPMRIPKGVQVHHTIHMPVEQMLCLVQAPWAQEFVGQNKNGS